MEFQDVVLPPLKNLVTIWQIDEVTNQKIEVGRSENLILYTWAYPLIMALCQGNSAFKLGTVYFEYKNVASPSDTVTIPTYDRTSQLSYYTSLANPVDYLRVPVSGLPSVTVQSGYESYFSGSQGNVATFSAQTSGTVGQLGRSFSNGSNSKVYGVALVASPVWSDATQDVVFARTYFLVGQQQLKAIGSQIGITWQIPFL